jgi:PEP-CTERM motif
MTATRIRILAAAAAWVVSAGATAAPVIVNTPFFNLEWRGPNSLGWTNGAQNQGLVRFGADSVSPVLTNSNPIDWQAGTVGWATLDSDPSVSRRIRADPLPTSPGFSSRYLDDAALYRGDWTLHFRNEVGTINQVDIPVNLSTSAQHAPKVENITLSGSGLTPTFTWAPPAGKTVNGYRVNIFDRALALAGQGSVVVSRNINRNTTSYTVDPAHFRVVGFEFQPDKDYVIEISIIQTKDGLSDNLTNSNVQAIARSYADFRTTTTGGPVVNLPVLQPDGSFLFNMSVVAGQTYFIDPVVAVGYDYEIGLGNPNFASVDLPDTIGDGIYDIFAFDAAGNEVLLADDWDGRDVFTFSTGGLSRFRVRGIEVAAGLDPNSTTAFITGLTFTGSGLFTGTQTPITVDTDQQIPEPSTWALLAAGLAVSSWRRRRR